MAVTPFSCYGAVMPRNPTKPSDLAGKMVKAEEIMREDKAILEALAGREIETQMKVARDVMVRRRRALGELARS
jgi:hypothetical protein